MKGETNGNEFEKEGGSKAEGQNSKAEGKWPFQDVPGHIGQSDNYSTAFQP